MDNITAWTTIIQACAPILIALVGIIPTVISNRKKTQESIDLMKESIQKDIKSTKAEVSDIQQTLEKHMREDEAAKALSTRYRILRFYDEICEGRNHSESHFEDVLDDIDFYEEYCEEHPKFKNSRGKAAMDHIQEVYHKVKAKGGFLTHE